MVLGYIVTKSKVVQKEAIMLMCYGRRKEWTKITQNIFKGKESEK